MRLSLDPTHVVQYLSSPDRPQSFKIDKLVDELMGLRTGKIIPKWRIVLKQIFEECDSDSSGSVSKNEWKKVTQSDSIVKKFEKVGISHGVLDTCFDMLDTDGSDDLTEDELVEGFTRLLQQGIRRRSLNPHQKDAHPSSPHKVGEDAHPKDAHPKSPSKGGKYKKDEHTPKHAKAKAKGRASVMPASPISTVEDAPDIPTEAYDGDENATRRDSDLSELGEEAPVRRNSHKAERKSLAPLDGVVNTRRPSSRAETPSPSSPSRRASATPKSGRKTVSIKS